MSYILDAIKKSEQQRQRSSRSSLEMPMMAPYRQKSNTYIIYALITACILALGVLISMFMDRNSNKPPVVQLAQAPSQTSPPAAVVAQPAIQHSEIKIVPAPRQRKNLIAPEAKTKPTKALESAITITKKKPLEAAHKPDTTTEEPEVKITKLANTAPIVAENLELEEQKVAPANEQNKEVVMQNRLLELSELPPHIQREIPDMSIAGFAYSSNPAERSVGINGRLLQEGDFLKSGMRLDRITSESLIFSYKGYHFRRGLQ